MYIYIYICRIPGDLQSVVFAVAAQSDEGRSTLFGLYTNAVYDAEKRKMLQGLASTRDPHFVAW